MTSTGTLTACLEQFGSMVQLHANWLKFKIYLAGVNDQMRVNLMQLTNFQEDTFPFRYLGIPLASEKLKISNYSLLIDKLINKINSWPRHTLSYASKLQLIA